MSSVHQVFLAVIRRFFESKFRKKSIVLRYDNTKKDTLLRVFFRVGTVLQRKTGRLRAGD